MRARLSFGVLAFFLVLAGSTAAADAPSLSVNDAMVTEGDSGTQNAVFTVSLSSPSADPVTVDYATADGSATAPTDYASASGTLTFAPGETAKQVTVAVAGDMLDEPHETYSLNLSSAAGATLADARGLGTILDNDAPVSLSVDDVSAVEAGGNATFTVSLSAASGKVITVAYATGDGTAGAPADYVAKQGTLVFLAGEAAKTVTVALVDDDVVEGGETFALRLSNAVNALLGDSEALGTILDDDLAPPPPLPPDDDPPAPPADENPPPSGDPPADDPPADDPPATEGPPALANGAPDCSAAAPSSSRLWAPNHKFRLVTLAGATDPDGDTVNYELLGVTQDEPLGHRPDAKPAERPDQLWLRAERKGTGDGRVYRIEFAAWDDHGNVCRGTAQVTVPHDRRHAAVDSGWEYDSFAL